MSPIAWNEISKNANGGTEQVARMLEASLGDRFDDFQIIPSRVRELDDSKYRVYWLHDLPWDPETNHLKDESSRNRFHKIVACGNWQKNMYQQVLGVPQDSRFITLETPINPVSVDFEKKDRDEQIRLIYTSTPQRGLDILVAVFVELAKRYPNIHLDVFSSFSIYGFDAADEQFRDLFDTCKRHPQITYHGAQPNEVVREYLARAHIFAYPSTWMECNSRSLIEAMSAGCYCVHSDLGGLADTAGGMTRIYPFDSDKNRHAKIFHDRLDHVIGELIDLNIDQSYLKFVKSYADRRYGSSDILYRWQRMLEEIREEYKGAGLSIPKSQSTQLVL